ncbi:MAG TPA: hypothetical protein VFD41_06515 [Actinomycetales bacterium]|nr:hypothetical protein [Actinomycetales bacterium]
MTQDPNQPAYPGGDAYPTSGESAPAGPMTPPPPVALAVKGMYVGAALSLLGAPR